MVMPFMNQGSLRSIMKREFPEVGLPTAAAAAMLNVQPIIMHSATVLQCVNCTPKQMCWPAAPAHTGVLNSANCCQWE